MNYTVQQITALTDTHISVLLSDDVAYDVDRGAFWEYITEGTGKYMYVLDHYEPQTGHRQTEHVIPYDEYWKDAIGSRVVKDQVNEYIKNDKSTQLDIDVVRAKSDCEEKLHHMTRCVINGKYPISDMHNDMFEVKNLISAYATAIKNQITYQNK